MFRKTILAATVALAGVASLRAGDETDRPFDVMVGDPAPQIAVGRWVKGEPVTSFQKGTTYVVEFWATWCKPCRDAMPHLSKLQADYAQKNVRFVGVSIWENDPSGVVPFVEKMGDKMAYTVAMDLVPEGEDGAYDGSKGKMAQTWMAGRGGIPASFIVDANGRVAWIGHPGGIDEPLSKVVAGEWDLAEASARYRSEIEAQREAQAVTATLEKELKALIPEGRFAEAVAALDQAFERKADLEPSFGHTKFVCLVRAGRHADSSAYGNRLVDGIYKDSAQALNYIAWMIVDPKSDAKERDLPLALRASKRAVELTQWKEPAAMDTYALALFLSGDTDRAIEVQEKAVQSAAGTPYEKDLKERLAQFRSKAGKG